MSSRVWIAAGFFLIAVTTGLLVGASPSPVVGTLLPLVFGLISVGGSIYTAGKGNDSTAQVGQQLVAFALGFLLGLWPGIYIKRYPDWLWPAAEPAYATLEFSDIRALAAFIELDNSMRDSGAGIDHRSKILASLQRAVKVRSGANGLLGEQDEDATKLILGEPIAKSTSNTFFPVARIPPSDLDRRRIWERFLGSEGERNG